MSDDEEIKRVLSNPENLIISDSLAGRIDFNEDIEPEITTTLIAGLHSLSGKFLRYSVDGEKEPHEEVSVSFSTSENNLEKIFKINTGSGCTLNIMNATITGTLLKISTKFISSELCVTVCLKRYN